MTTPTNEQLLRQTIRHQLHVLKWGNGTANAIVALLNSVDADIAALLMRDDLTELNTQRLNNLLAEIRAVNDQVYRKAFKKLELDLVDLAHAMAEAAKTMLVTATGITALSVPAPSYLATIATSHPIGGKLLATWIEDMSRNRVRAIETAIRSGMVQGQTTDQIVRKIIGTRANKYRDGIMEMSRRSATSMVLTATSTVNNEARDAVYRSNSDIMKGVQWLATLDTRTTPVCQSNDGKFWRLDEPHPKPPLHIRCRSVLLPVTKSFEELGIDRPEITRTTRASMDGQVPAKLSYTDWLKEQSAERQDEILGPTRGRLFRENSLDPKELYRVDGSYRSIDELMAMISRK